MLKRIISFLLLFCVLLNIFNSVKVQAMSLTAVAGVGILASMLVAGGYLVYQNRDSAFALLHNVWESLPPRTKDAITLPWKAGRKVVRFGSEVWAEVVRVLLQKKVESLTSSYEMPITAEGLDLNDFRSYHYYEELNNYDWRYWYMLYPVSSGQVELFMKSSSSNRNDMKVVINFQSTEGMAGEPYLIRIEKYEFIDGQYVLDYSLERMGSYVGIQRNYYVPTNRWMSLYVNIYNSQGSRADWTSISGDLYNSGTLSILDGSFSYRQEAVYNPYAGDVQVNEDVLPEDAANKDVSLPGLENMSDLVNYLSKLVGVTEDNYSEIIDITKGIADYVGDIYSSISAGFNNLITGVSNIANTLVESISVYVGDIYDSISTGFSDLVTGVSSIVNTLVEGISGYVSDIYDALTSGFANVMNGVNSIADILSAGLIGDLVIDYSPLLNLSIVDKFPFSLPFDIYNAISGFSAGGDLPELNFGFYDPVNKRIINNRIDLGEIDFIVDYAPFVRAVLLFCYIVGLVYVSRRIMGGGV